MGVEKTDERLSVFLHVVISGYPFARVKPERTQGILVNIRNGANIGNRCMAGFSGLCAREDSASFPREGKAAQTQ